MGDITHSAGGPTCFPSSCVQKFLISEFCLCFSSLTFSFYLHVLEHQGLAAGSAPSMQPTRRRRGLAVPDTAHRVR